MSWLGDYRKRVVDQARHGGPYGGPDKLHFMWPFFLGGLVFAGFDLSLELSETTRYVLLGTLVFPGAVWLLYLTYHQFVGFRRWLAARSAEDSING